MPMQRPKILEPEPVAKPLTRVPIRDDPPKQKKIEKVKRQPLPRLTEKEIHAARTATHWDYDQTYGNPEKGYDMIGAIMRLQGVGCFVDEQTGNYIFKGPRVGTQSAHAVQQVAEWLGFRDYRDLYETWKIEGKKILKRAKY